MTTSVPKQILIADDEPNVRFVFRTALEAAGYQASTAKDGEEALMWLRGSRPDLVLLDLQMPGIDGMEVLESMRCSGDEIPVVIVTAHGNVSEAVRAMRLGVVDFLEKPLGPATLRSVVADVLDRHDRDGYGPTATSDVTDPAEAIEVRTRAGESLKRRESDAPAAFVREATSANPGGIGDEGPMGLPRVGREDAKRPHNFLKSAKRALNDRHFARASALLREAMKEDPASAEPRYLMGVVHEMRNKKRAACKDYRAALEIDPDFGPARLHLARLEDERWL